MRKQFLILKFVQLIFLLCVPLKLKVVYHQRLHLAINIGLLLHHCHSSLVIGLWILPHLLFPWILLCPTNYCTNLYLLVRDITYHRHTLFLVVLMVNIICPSASIFDRSMVFLEFSCILAGPYRLFPVRNHIIWIEINKIPFLFICQG